MLYAGRVLLVNGVDIISEVNITIAAFKAKDSERMGEAIGRILADAVLTSPPPQSTAAPLSLGHIKSIDVLEGVVRGFAIDFPAISECISKSKGRGSI